MNRGLLKRLLSMAGTIGSEALYLDIKAELAKPPENAARRVRMVRLVNGASNPLGEELTDPTPLA